MPSPSKACVDVTGVYQDRSGYWTEGLFPLVIGRPPCRLPARNQTVCSTSV